MFTAPLPFRSCPPQCPAPRLSSGSSFSPLCLDTCDGAPPFVPALSMLPGFGTFSNMNKPFPLPERWFSLVSPFWALSVCFSPRSSCFFRHGEFVEPPCPPPARNSVYHLGRKGFCFMFYGHYLLLSPPLESQGAPFKSPGPGSGTK